jgi:protein-S-isoprenylcysteine O-methyltransferase Ste14
VVLLPSLKIGIWNIWLFMSVFILQMVPMMLAGKRIWERSHVPVEAKKNRFEKNVGYIANGLWLAALIYSVFLPLLLNSDLFYIGFSIFFVGLLILAISTYDFISTPPDQLIDTGIYRISRHPMYLATSFICLGSGIAAGSWAFVILSIMMVICFHQEALIEERYCLDKYGNTYQEYSNKVPRWLGMPKKSK